MDPTNYTIKELKTQLKKVKVTTRIINLLKDDKRKGVQKLARKYQKRREKKQQLLKKWDEMNSLEKRLRNNGYQLVCGLDEAGRGPLAGPVVAASVILNNEFKILGLKDSKQLTVSKRKELKTVIEKKALAVGIGIVDNQEIDRINIQQASFKAMIKALHSMDYIPDFLLVDGNREIPKVEIPQEAVVEGDSQSNSIAAASIIAKVTRDNIIDDYHQTYPQYNFLSNKGYGTQEHIEALKKYGPSPIHRFSYNVVEKYSKRKGEVKWR